MKVLDETKNPVTTSGKLSDAVLIETGPVAEKFRST